MRPVHVKAAPVGKRRKFFCRPHLVCYFTQNIDLRAALTTDEVFSRTTILQASERNDTVASRCCIMSVEDGAKCCVCA